MRSNGSDNEHDTDSSAAPAGFDLGLTSDQRRIFDELEALMALNTPVDRTTADLPCLWSLSSRQGDESGLISLVNSSAQGLSSPQREAVACLYPKSFDAESGNLTGRKRQAAQRLGKPYNTARARRDGQPNDFDQLLVAMAIALNEMVAELPPAGKPDSAGLSFLPTGMRRSISPAVVGVGVSFVVFLLVAGLFVVNVENGSSPGSAGAIDRVTTSSTVASTAVPSTISDSAAPHSGVATPSALGQAQAGRIQDCNRPIGGPLVPADDNVWIAQPMINAYQEASSGGFDLACPSATAQSWGDAWYQEIDGVDQSHAGTIVAWGGPTSAEVGGPTAVFLPRTLWLAYWNAGLSGGELSQSLAGFPLDFAVDDENHWITHTSLGGLLIAEQPNISARWIPHQAMSEWESTGGIHGSLGLPMTNVEYVDGILTQTYERGKAFVGPEGLTVSEVYDQKTIEADVAELSRTTNGILSTYDSTDWWIDDAGVRHWIPSGPDHDDGAMWECLGGLPNTIAEGLDGWVIAAFPLGENATCSVG